MRPNDPARRIRAWHRSICPAHVCGLHVARVQTGEVTHVNKTCYLVRPVRYLQVLHFARWRVPGQSPSTGSSMPKDRHGCMAGTHAGPASPTTAPDRPNLRGATRQGGLIHVRDSESRTSALSFRIGRAAKTGASATAVYARPEPGFVATAFASELRAIIEGNARKRVTGTLVFRRLDDFTRRSTRGADGDRGDTIAAIRQAATRHDLQVRDHLEEDRDQPAVAGGVHGPRCERDLDVVFQRDRCASVTASAPCAFTPSCWSQRRSSGCLRERCSTATARCG